MPRQRLTARLGLLCMALVTLTALALAPAFAALTGSAPANSRQVFLPLVTVPPRPSGMRSPTSLVVTSATHLGVTGANQAAAVDVAPDGSVVLGATLPAYQPPGLDPITLLPGEAGFVLRFDPEGALRSATRLGTALTDLEVSPTGTIFACGDFGLAALTADGASLQWHAEVGAGRRCASGVDTTSAVLVGAEVAVFAADGTPLGRWAAGGGTANDIAVDSAHAQVIVTGFTQVTSTLQIPFIRAYSYTGDLRWRSYDFPAGTPNLGTADTRGERIAIGRDGKLYFAGSINGGTGASIFIYDPKDTSQSATDRIVVTDRFTDPFNVGSVKLLWIARFNPADGTLELAQSLLTRLSSGRGNSISAAALSADAQGTVYVAGTAFASLDRRDEVTINETALGAYGGDAYALVLTPDFRQRQLWVAFTAPSGGKGANGLIAVRDATVAFAATVSEGTFITHRPVQERPAGGSAAYLAIWAR